MFSNPPQIFEHHSPVLCSTEPLQPLQVLELRSKIPLYNLKTRWPQLRSTKPLHPPQVLELRSTAPLNLLVMPGPLNPVPHLPVENDH